MSDAINVRPNGILTPCALISGTVYSVGRGFRADSLNVTIETPHGMTTLAVSIDCATQYVVGMPVALTVSRG